jgi:hypothetical protein
MAALAIVTLSEQTIGTETFLPLSEDSWLVRSGSQSGQWYSITLWGNRVSSCSCPGFRFRSDCRHVKALDSQGQQPCAECGHGTFNRVDGRPLCCGCATR